MSYKIRCYTLFDITCTGVSNRRVPAGLSNDASDKWQMDRNTQSNFDTLLQVISLRSQPDTIISPKKVLAPAGLLVGTQEAWMFVFEVYHQLVFSDGVDEFGLLYADCNGVPMINTKNGHSPESLNTCEDVRNIYFEAITDEEF